MNKSLFRRLQEERKIWNNKIKSLKNLKKEGCIIIKPNKSLATLDNSYENLKRCIKNGRMAATSNKKLEKFINELKKSKRRKFYFV